VIKGKRKRLKPTTKKEKIMNITIEELRHLLFEIKTQDMTVRELRSKLFDEENQDFELNRVTKRKLNQY